MALTKSVNPHRFEAAWHMTRASVSYATGLSIRIVPGRTDASQAVEDDRMFHAWSRASDDLLAAFWDNEIDAAYDKL